MFRRTDTDLPAQASFKPDLKSLGIKRNGKGQYVTDNEPNAVVNFKVTEDDEYNERRWQAFQQAIYNDIHAELADLGVFTYYLSNEGGDHTISREKPPTAHVTILATNMSEMRLKKDVVVAIADSRQPLAIWHWKTVTTEGGVNAGSAVGLVKYVRDKFEKSGLPASAQPGFIMLNPGELLHSHDLKQSMTRSAWQRRERPNAFSEAYSATPSNKISGHESALAHVTTVLKQYLPKLTASNVRLRIVAHGDGGENLLKYVNDRLTANPNSEILDQIAAVTLVQSSHRMDQVTISALSDLLADRGRAYETSPLAKGTLLAGRHKKPAPALQDNDGHSGQQLAITEAQGNESAPTPRVTHEGEKSSETPRRRAFTMPPRDEDVIKAQERAIKGSDEFQHFMNVIVRERLEKRGLTVAPSIDDPKKPGETSMRSNSQPACTAEGPYVDFSDRPGLGRQFQRGCGHDLGFPRDAGFEPTQRGDEVANWVLSTSPEFDRDFQLPAIESVASSSDVSAGPRKFPSNPDQSLLARQCGSLEQHESPEQRGSPEQPLIDLGGDSNKASDENEGRTTSEQPIARDFAISGTTQAADSTDPQQPRPATRTPSQPIPARARSYTAPASLSGELALLSTSPPGESTLARGESPLALRMKASEERLKAAPAEAPEGAYDYYKEGLLCDTFSAGIEDVAEAVFPAVYKDVAEFLTEGLA